MTLTITSIAPLPRQNAADDALAAAVDRFLPCAEAHEIQFIRDERVLQDADKALAHALDRLVPVIEDHELEHIRDELRSRGFDVLPLIRKV